MIRYQHYKLLSHYNTRMSIGVWGNVWLTLTGLFTLAMLQSDAGTKDIEEITKKAKYRSGFALAYLSG
jgi:mannan endo-1,6-alpha-mannosidase